VSEWREHSRGYWSRTIGPRELGVYASTAGVRWHIDGLLNGTADTIDQAKLAAETAAIDLADAIVAELAPERADREGELHRDLNGLRCLLRQPFIGFEPMSDEEVAAKYAVAEAVRDICAFLRAEGHELLPAQIEARWGRK
jgi:hypothetical protein